MIKRERQREIVLGDVNNKIETENSTFKFHDLRLHAHQTQKKINRI